MLFADIIIDISVKSLDRPFQYRVPDPLQADAVIGALVDIPFGKGNRTVQGYIIGLSDQAKFDIRRTKDIIAVVKQGVVAQSHLLSLAYWIKTHYGGTMNDAIKAVMPVRREIQIKEKKRVIPIPTREDLRKIREELAGKHQMARVRIIDALLQAEDYADGMDYDVLCKAHKATLSVLRAMQDKGWIRIEVSRSYRNPYYTLHATDKEVILNEQQQKAVTQICGNMDAGQQQVYLLHGVTGSGKTEVYMQCIEHVIRSGRQAIVLIPEIALTFQTVQRFYARFGDRVSVMHSRLSAGERYDQFERAQTGEIDIMIGPRSALFTPFERLGIIVMDEEHESSYQSENVPKYHAREVAVQRAKMLGASVLLGSATPSLEAYYHTTTGEYTRIELTERAGGASLPRVEIVDLREELAAKNFSIFSRSLTAKIQKRLERGEQTILFLNRRGFAGFVSCRKCGEVVGCPHCAVSLKPHSRAGKVTHLTCHYCGYTIPMPQTCPSCGSKYIGTFGLGTEQVEQMAASRFPGARVLRMDADTTGGKEGHDRILKQFAAGEADILVGTQMIVKGHDFAKVTLVGILAADLSLNVGDYRAAERTYQLLAQAAGRAGRGDLAGEVVLQTYQPEHYSITCAADQNYVQFYKQEILMRQMLQYPPVSHILGVLVLSKDEALATSFADELADMLRGTEGLVLLGPSEAPIAKLRDVYRYMIYGKSAEYECLVREKDRLEQYIRQRGLSEHLSVQFSFDHE